MVTWPLVITWARSISNDRRSCCTIPWSTAKSTVWLGMVTDVLAADAATDPAGVAAVERSLVEPLSAEIVNQLVAGLQDRFPVSVNQNVLDQIF